VLAFQLNETVCGIGLGTASAVKFTPVFDAPFIETEAVEGVKV
jgi:hypothetical protein